MNEREKDRRLERGSPRFLVACGRGGIDAHRGTRVERGEKEAREKGLGGGMRERLRLTNCTLI